MFKKQPPAPEGSDTLVAKLVQGQIKIRSLDLNIEKAFKNVLEALNQNKNLAKELDPKFPLEKELIIQWLSTPKSVYNAKSKIEYLDEKKLFSKDDHDNDVLIAYLNLVLSDPEGSPDFQTFKSFHNELMLKINFETKEGEEIVYRDKELDLPVSMRAELSFYLKIIDPYAFMQYLDVSISQINVQLLLARLTPKISTLLRAGILDIIQEKNLCYYDLTKYYGVIASNLQEKLQEVFFAKGVAISNTHIKNTKISNKADQIFEDQRILFMQKEKELDLQHKAELMSLENYERKAAIHSKYPSYEVGLTEKEKDNAIDRYLTKQRGYKEENYKTAKKAPSERRDDDLGKITSFQKEKTFKDLPIQLNVNAFKTEIIAAIIAVVVFIIGIAVAANGAFFGFIMIAAAVVVAGVAIANIVNKNKTINKVNNTTTDDDSDDNNNSLPPLELPPLNLNGSDGTEE